MIIIGLTVVDYLAALRIAGAGSRHGRRLWLLVSLTANLMMLVYFKYLNYTVHTVHSLFGSFGVSTPSPVINIILPLGISFHTFQSMGYIIDVYRGLRPPERRLHVYALFVAYFPQLVAGPIERSTGLLPQLDRAVAFDAERAKQGLRLMAWGFFKKLIIADHLAALVNPAFADPGRQSAFVLLKAIYCFSIQIYCDFSGYSDIAIGAACVLGHRLVRNFDHPYEARSVAEFWRRWHISLSTWFRDYLYIPLGGNRRSRVRWFFNIGIVFALSGLWHGANWTFLAWGLLHATYIWVFVATTSFRQYIVATFRLDEKPRLHDTLSILVTFNLVTFAWIFFRAASLHDAAIILQTLWAGRGSLLRELLHDPMTMAIGAFVLGVEALSLWRRRMQFTAWPLPFRWAVYVASILFILILGQLRAYDFIYFQF